MERNKKKELNSKSSTNQEGWLPKEISQSNYSKLLPKAKEKNHRKKNYSSLNPTIRGIHLKKIDTTENLEILSWIILSYLKKVVDFGEIIRYLQEKENKKLNADDGTIKKDSTLDIKFQY
jgi:hypothetical protein